MSAAQTRKLSRAVAAVLLWLLVINLGIAFGAGVYEHRIVLPRWFSTSSESGAHWNANAAIEDDTGRKFWFFVTTVPLTLIALANLLAAWRASDPVRPWWLAAALAAVADRALTFLYFIPAMLGLMEAPDSPESVAALTRWLNLNLLRLVLLAVAWLAALRAFSLFYQQREAPLTPP
jgi:hypothetical protein